MATRVKAFTSDLGTAQFYPMLRVLLVFGVAGSGLFGRESTGYAEFTVAYQSLANRDYDAAIDRFRAGLAKDPGAIQVHKDLAYTLLKAGDCEGAREEFGAALKLDPGDGQARAELVLLDGEVKAVPHAGGGVPAGWSNVAARSMGVWAFFDPAYRQRADLDYLARRWREAGIAALHVAAWYNLEPDAAADAFLGKLIDACHRHSVLVYAWLVLPYAGERFWAAHPEWREKNGLLQDAQIGWRKPMNLQNRECSRTLAADTKRLLERFEWDGVNLGELGFGGGGAAQFTPMNDNVRAEFTEIAGWDPKLLFVPGSAHASEGDRNTFLRFRDVLCSRMKAEWRSNLKESLKGKPYLDFVFTRERSSKLVLEDAAGKQIGTEVSAFDGTGTDLLEAIHAAAPSSAHVAIYAENFIRAGELPLVDAAASLAHVTEERSNVLQVEAREQSRIAWPAGAVTVDGGIWPLRSAKYVIVPAGHHTVSAGVQMPPLAIRDFTGEIQFVAVSKAGVGISYVSQTRAFAAFDENVGSISIDGVPGPIPTECRVQLPAGQHLVTFTRR